MYFAVNWVSRTAVECTISYAFGVATPFTKAHIMYKFVCATLIHHSALTTPVTWFMCVCVCYWWSVIPAG